MKYIIIFLLLLLPTVTFADEVTLPYNVVISDPLTDAGDRKSIKVNFDDNTALIVYELWNDDRTDLIERISYTIDGAELITILGGASAAAAFKSAVSSSMSTHLQSRRETQAK